MLDELRFVMGAVAKKDLIPAMTHFAIENNTIRSYNGALALSSPLPFDINCKPKAAQLVQAISRCSSDHTVVISMTEAGRLQIQNGSYKAFVECTEEETPHVMPEGEDVHFDGTEIRKAFEMVMPFIGSDAARPWTNGVLLSGQSAFATNNVCVVEYWLGTKLPFTVNVPKDAIKEFLRVGETPTHAQLATNSLTFHFPNGKWIRSQLFDAGAWPSLAPILDVESNPVPLEESFFDALEAIKPFTDKINNVYFRDGGIATHTTEGVGASYGLDNFQYEGAYALPMLELLKGIVEKIDWSRYPFPCPFFGNILRGAIIGRKIASAG